MNVRRPRLRLWFTDIADGAQSRRAALRLDHLGGAPIDPRGWAIVLKRGTESLRFALPEQLERNQWRFEHGETIYVLAGLGADALLVERARRPTYWLYLQQEERFLQPGEVDAELRDPDDGVVVSSRRLPDP